MREIKENKENPDHWIILFLLLGLISFLVVAGFCGLLATHRYMIVNVDVLAKKLCDGKGLTLDYWEADNQKDIPIIYCKEIPEQIYDGVVLKSKR